MQNKYKILLLCGGESTEHAISLLSAQAIAQILLEGGHQVYLVPITTTGEWIDLGWVSDSTQLMEKLPQKQITWTNQKTFQINPWKNQIGSTLAQIDVVIPALHGPKCEDGLIQGLLNLIDKPYMACNQKASSLGMDKVISKQIAQAAGIKVAPYLTLLSHQTLPDFHTITNELGPCIFIKPAYQGSSIGVTKATSESEYRAGCQNAFKYDHKILIESAIIGKEVECGVIGYISPQASTPGELKISHDFYSYEAKYLDANGAKMIIPADLPSEVLEEIKNQACKVFSALNCEILSRIDFFITKNNEIIFNEVSTFPGFTQFSMFPAMWEATGFSRIALLEELIRSAINRHRRNSQLLTSQDKNS